MDSFEYKKSLGQNFLRDENVLRKIVDSSEIDNDTLVIEVGPGAGSLSKLLIPKAGFAILFEIDVRLKEKLDSELGQFNNYEIIFGDFLKQDISNIRNKYNYKKIYVVANLPYYITTPIIMKLFESGAPIESVTVMVQKEVADRMVMGPGNKDYGSLSLAVAYHASAQSVMDVPPSCFIPQPGVGSAVVYLKKHENKPVQVNDEKYMFEIIRTAFNQRRKTLSNSLSNNPALKVSRQMVQDALTDMGIDEKARGEVLDLSQFAELSDILQSKGAMLN